jgi:hypothetical protein
MAYNVKEFFGINKKDTIDYKKTATKLLEDIPSPAGDTTPVSQAEKSALEDKLAV